MSEGADADRMRSDVSIITITVFAMRLKVGIPRIIDYRYYFTDEKFGKWKIGKSRLEERNSVNRCRRFPASVDYKVAPPFLCISVLYIDIRMMTKWLAGAVGGGCGAVVVGCGLWSSEW